MGKLPDVREYEGMGGRCIVARAFGGVIEFDDGSVLLMLAVAGHDGAELIYPLSPGRGVKARDLMKRIEEALHEGGEGVTDFEKKVLRAAINHSLTDLEREAYTSPDADNGIFWDLPGNMEDMEGEGEE